MSSLNIEDYLDQLEDMVDGAWAMPLSGGKVVVNADKMRSLIDSVRSNLPAEIRQAKAIVQDRAKIVATAQSEAKSIIRDAEERRNMMVSKEEVVLAAQEKATEIMGQTQKRAREMRKNAQEFTEELLRRTEEMLTANINDIRQARSSIRGGNRPNTEE